MSRVVFKHGRSFHDGGWFDTRGGKPQVQSSTHPGRTVGDCRRTGAYPATTATDNRDIEDGEAFECRLAGPAAAAAVRILVCFPVATTRTRGFPRVASSRRTPNEPRLPMRASPGA